MQQPIFRAFFIEGEHRELVNSVSTHLYRLTRSVISSTSPASFNWRQYYITDREQLECLRAPQGVWLWPKPAVAHTAKYPSITD